MTFRNRISIQSKIRTKKKNYLEMFRSTIFAKTHLQMRALSVRVKTAMMKIITNLKLTKYENQNSTVVKCRRYSRKCRVTKHQRSCPKSKITQRRMRISCQKYPKTRSFSHSKILTEILVLWLINFKCKHRPWISKVRSVIRIPIHWLSNLMVSRNCNI